MHRRIRCWFAGVLTTPRCDRVWGVEVLAPGELTPRRRGWNSDKRISYTYEASRRPMPCLLAQGASTASVQASTAHAEHLRLPRHAANRFRAVTPGSVPATHARVAPGHHVPAGSPDFGTTQNTFAVPRDWYVATCDSTEPVQLPKGRGKLLPPVSVSYASMIG